MLLFPRMPFARTILLGALAAMTSETQRVGGSGGNRTVEMDCGSNAYIVGATATGGRDGTFGFNLLRRVKFTCRTFNGTTPGASTFQTVEAVADHAASVNVSNGSGTCTNDHVLQYVELYAGSFIDRLNTVGCVSATQDQADLNINAGGDGGTRQFLECPAAEALFKIEAKAGDAIDSLKGFCRSFGGISALSVPTQIGATASPKPSLSNPLVIPVKANKTIQFTISNFNANFSRVDVGVTGVTDLLGGGSANPPEFKVELINPSGVAVATKSFSNVQFGVIYGVTFQINANGVWKLRVTNLKQQIGSLNVQSFDAGAALR